MSSTLRKCADGIWRRKFKSSRYKRPRVFCYVEIPGEAVKLIEQPQKQSPLPKCWYCGAPAKTKDHVIPRSKGGRGAGNKVWACLRCNQEKSNLLLEDYRAFVAMRKNLPIEEVVFFRERAVVTSSP